ncbi:MAG: methyltransferase domain-containing protein [Acidobacteria bacterium]|nr:methyltransferase domain-containing protein [Acidobacteriota bacterium]
MTVPAEPDAAVQVDVDDLRGKVQQMYEAVARHPLDGRFHFEMGRAMAERLGYRTADLDRVPAPAIESFAGVGYYFDLAALAPGERVVDLGSGSGMDAFVAALQVGTAGRVVGIDMTVAQREKARRLADAAGFAQVEFLPGFIEEIPLESGQADCVISNGVINLCPDKARVFAEVARVLRPGGRLAMADIVTELPLPSEVTCNATLWAACIGGAAQQDAYRSAVEAAGLRVVSVRENPAYAFLSKSAQGASREFGVKSISLAAAKERI